jgi:hypothetical protein
MVFAQANRGSRSCVMSVMKTPLQPAQASGEKMDCKVKFLFIYLLFIYLFMVSINDACLLNRFFFVSSLSPPSPS